MTNQQEFDSKYISSVEIRDTLSIGRSFVNWAKSHGKLPQPITIAKNAPDLWIRSEVAPIIEAWAKDLQKSRGK